MKNIINSNSILLESIEIGSPKYVAAPNKHITIPNSKYGIIFFV